MEGLALYAAMGSPVLRISAYPIIETSRSSSTLCASRATRNVTNETLMGRGEGGALPTRWSDRQLALQLPLPDVPVEVAPRVRLEVFQRALHGIDRGEVVQIDHRIVLVDQPLDLVDDLLPLRGVEDVRLLVEQL